MSIPPVKKAENVLIMKCINGHKYKRLDSDPIEYKNLCPICKTYSTGITGARWLNDKEKELLDS